MTAIKIQNPLLVKKDGVDVGYAEVLSLSGSAVTATSSGSAVTVSVDSMGSASHELLQTLTHDLVENSYDTVTYSGNLISVMTQWKDLSMTNKLREHTLTYISSSLISKIVTTQYDGSGSLRQTMTEDVFYDSQNRITSISRARS